MLLFHNQKVDRIQNGYKQECEEKARAKEAGLTLKQLRDKENDDNGGGATKDKKKMMKKFGKKNDFEVEIVMKGKDGVVENFDEAQEEEKADDGPVVI